MRKFKFFSSLSLAIFLIVFPEPITTGLGVAVLSWAIMHFWVWPGPISGACRCDACRYGIHKDSHSSYILTESSILPLVPSPSDIKIGRMRRTQATLPLTRGKGLTQSYLKHGLNGGW